MKASYRENVVVMSFTLLLCGSYVGTCVFAVHVDMVLAVSSGVVKSRIDILFFCTSAHHLQFRSFPVVFPISVRSSHNSGQKSVVLPGSIWTGILHRDIERLPYINVSGLLPFSWLNGNSHEDLQC